MSRPESSTEITPMARLFTYHIFGEPDELGAWRADVSSYRLRVSGRVRNPLELTYEDITSGFDAVAATTVLQCTTNIHWGRIRVLGVPIAAVLERAGVAPGARKLAIRGRDGFGSDLSLEQIGREPLRFLLAYEMNGAPLPPEHGYPIRVVSDGRYGYKWCKWVSDLEVTDRDFKGHYEGRRGWSDAGLRGTKVT